MSFVIMDQVKNAIIAGTIFGGFMGLLLLIFVDPIFALVVGPSGGLLFGFFLYQFASSTEVRQQTQLPLDEEMPILSSPANHFLNREGVGGRLYLFEDKIVFKSHQFNFQNHEMTIDRAHIKEVKFYNILGIIPTGMKVLTHDGRTEKFVVNGRKDWQKYFHDEHA